MWCIVENIILAILLYSLHYRTWVKLTIVVLALPYTDILLFFFSSDKCSKSLWIKASAKCKCNVNTNKTHVL